MKTKSTEKGFTLVELSIVLIIIGLIVGGVLAGQSLIASARVQADINNFNKVDAGVGTFSLKYGGLPGDIAATYTTAIPDANATPAARGGDANGQIGTPTGNFVNGEIGFASQHLAAASLINIANFDTQANASNAIGVGILPARIGGGILLYGNGSANFAIFGAASNTGAAVPLLGGNYSPEQASFIDNKVDDNIAITGIVTSGAVSGNDLGAVGATGTGATQCNSAAGVYTLANAGKNCSVRIRLSS